MLRFSSWVVRIVKGLFVVALRYLVFVADTDAKVALRRVVQRCDALSCLVLCCVVVYGWCLLFWALFCCAIVYGFNSCHELGRCGASRSVALCFVVFLLLCVALCCVVLICAASRRAGFCCAGWAGILRDAGGDLGEPVGAWEPREAWGSYGDLGG